MKKVILLAILYQLSCAMFAQRQYLRITGSAAIEQSLIDSLNYAHEHPDASAVLKEVNNFSDKLLRAGFLEANLKQTGKSNDSTFNYDCLPGKRTSSLLIYMRHDDPLRTVLLKETKSDTLTIPFTTVNDFMNQSMSVLEKKGFALARTRLTNFEKRDNELIAQLEIISEKKRTLDDIVIKGEVKFPESHRKMLLRQFKKQIFNQDNLKRLYDNMEKFRFVRQTKYPEILFKTDSTKVYCYLEKSKSNTFEGFIGFSNDETQKTVINGYLDLSLKNLLNTGETFALNWKSNGNDQKTFNASIELPYIFESPLAAKAHLNIFKQDSTFQNTITALDLGYLLNYNTRIYLGYQSSESSDIQNQNTFTLSDYSNSYVTSQFQYMGLKPDELLFSEKTKIALKTGIGSRRSKFNKDRQVFFDVDLKHTFFLNNTNNIQIRSQNYYLNSDRYIINELYRFGGIQSVRGFNENSLQANLLTSVLSEYRYVIARNLYVHSITDYGYFYDETTKNKGALLGLGLGFGLVTANGLFNFVYANGSTGGQEIKGSNSIVHISFKTQF